MNAHSVRRLLQLTLTFAACTSAAVACGSGSDKKATTGNRFNPNDGGQANAGAAGESSTGGSSKTGGTSTGGSSMGAQSGSANDGGANDGGQGGSAGDGGQAGSASEGGAGDGGATDGNAGSGDAGEAGSGGAGGFANCAEVETSVGPSLLNGSFELPALGSPQWFVIVAGQEPANFGWSVLVDVDISYVGWTSGQGVITGPAKEGIQYLDVVAFGSDGALKQTVDVVPGASYVLELSYANTPIAEPPLPSASATVTARVCDHIIFTETITHSTSIISDFDWTDFSRTFEATDSIVTLEIVETVGGGHGGIYLDAVSLTEAP